MNVLVNIANRAGLSYFNTLGFSILLRVSSYLQQGEISRMNHCRWDLVFCVWSNVFSDCFCYKRTMGEKFRISSQSDCTECSDIFAIDSKLISGRSMQQIFDHRIFRDNRIPSWLFCFSVLRFYGAYSVIPSFWHLRQLRIYELKQWLCRWKWSPNCFHQYMIMQAVVFRIYVRWYSSIVTQ